MSYSNSDLIKPEIKHLSLRLFILRIGEGKNNPIYRIAYGVVSPSDHSLEEATGSEFSKLGSYGNKKVFLGSISIFSEREKVLGIYDALSIGSSLKESLDRYGISNDNLKYDVKYIRNGISVPWHKANILGNQLSDSRYICMLEPETLFEIDGHLLEEALYGAMRTLSVKLSEATGLPFDTSYDHIGNLEILIAPDQDIYGRSLVKHWQDKESFTQYVELSSKLTDGADLVTVNIKLKAGGVITIDTLLSDKPKDNENSTFSIPSEYPPQAVEIKIWLTKSSEVRLVHLSTHHFIGEICFSLGIVQSEIHIHSDWLDRVKGAMPKNKKELVDKASSIQRTRSESHHRINKGLPQWLKRKVTIKPIERCDDAYFPAGWDCETQESGSLSFLEWFKAKTKGAKSVFLQDPYFEDVALSFIALSDIQGECIILTQTDLKTNTDNTSYTGGGSQRKDRILSLIKDNPSLYDSMQLIIRDMAGSGPKLHDRYLFIGYDDGRCEGYMLSNSLQGATKKSPLLITRIGTPVLVKVKKHIAKLIDPDKVETIYHYSDRTSSSTQEGKEIADADFYNFLQAMNHPLDPDCLDQVLNDILKERTADRISTFGYYLAHSSDDKCDSIRQYLGNQIANRPKAIKALKDFILEHHKSSFPIGFEGFSGRDYRDNHFSNILESSYHEIIHRNHTHLIGNCYKGFSYPVWGMECACMLLIRASSHHTIDTLKQLRDQLVSIKTDKTITSIYKITNTLLCMIFDSVVFDWDGDLMENMLRNSSDWCRGLGALILIYKADDSNFDIRSYIELLQSHDERITLCDTIIFSSKRSINRDDIYNLLIEEINGSDIEYAYKNILDILRGYYPLELQETYIRKIYEPLIQDGRLDKDKLSSRLTEALFDECIQSEPKYRPDVLAMGLCLINGSFKVLQEKSQKQLMETERKLNRLIIKDQNNVFQACSVLRDLKPLLYSIIAEHPCHSDELLNIYDKIQSVLRRVGIEEEL